ncbi:MAG: rod shape-determining protein RodA [Spirochaetes bacterium]|nr:rod shape-determining protein RodA [Spirochaetota bacterium]HPO60077.1 rod shape-determining protein RodA [Exilispira sp.]HQQ18857.1 rod shape-determining protein RodA [Exilispira sp.]
MKEKKLNIAHIDYLLFAILLILLVISVLFIYSGTKNIPSLKTRYLMQIIYASVGIIGGIFVLLIDIKKIQDISEFLYLFGILMLIATLLIGTRVRGSKSWIKFGFFSIQPSEFMKLFYILFVAKIITLYQNDEKYRSSVKFFIIVGLVTALPAILILLQPDFGSTFILVLIFLTIAFLANLNIELLILTVIMGVFVFSLPLLRVYLKLIDTTVFIKNLVFSNKYFLIISALMTIVGVIILLISTQVESKTVMRISFILIGIGISIVLSILADKILADYQKKRLLVFINPELDKLGSGYNIIQSKIAIGAGGLFGKGLFRGTQSQFGFLPERSTDFIFSIIGEEGGFILSFLILIIYGTIFVKILTLIRITSSFYNKMVLAGIFGYFFNQSILNIGMTIGLMPITGVPLPFLSSGGSSLLTSIFAYMLVLNISMKRYSSV